MHVLNIQKRFSHIDMQKNNNNNKKKKEFKRYLKRHEQEEEEEENCIDFCPHIGPVHFKFLFHFNLFSWFAFDLSLSFVNSTDNQTRIPNNYMANKI